MQYVMLLCGEEGSWENASAAETEAAMNEIQAWSEKWAAEGKLAESSAELDSSRKAKTVSRGPDGKPVVTDGPYLELKEVVGGFIMLNADNLEDAVAVAATWPGIPRFGDKVEVRPVMQR